MVNQNRVIQELAGDFAPYAATSNVMNVITRRRERGLPSPISGRALETISISPGNISRTLQALRFLRLMEDDGSHSEIFNRLSQAGEADGEYRELLGEIIRNAYHQVFAIVDPAQDNDVAIHDAFRQFQPEAQRARMVTFFLGMCEQAGIIARRGRERRAEGNQRPRVAGQRRPRRQPVQAQVPAAEQQPAVVRQAANEDTEYRLIFAVIQQLPTQRQWTASRRQRWLSAVEAAVDLMVDVVEETPSIQNEGEAQ